jgi:hypothetical protein
LEVIGRVDSGKTCADDQDVEMFETPYVSSIQGRALNSGRQIGPPRYLALETVLIKDMERFCP